MKNFETHYVMMKGNKYLKFDPHLDKYRFVSCIDSLDIWDFHHNLDCFEIPDSYADIVHHKALTGSILKKLKNRYFCLEFNKTDYAQNS